MSQINNKESENMKSLFHSKSQNKYDLNNVELSLTNSIDNSDFVLLKNGTIKKKRKKNSYYDEYLDNKRLNQAMENTYKKRVKSFPNIKNKKIKLFKSNNDMNKINIKKIVHSDNNIFSKAQKINIFENVIINNLNKDNLKLSYSFNSFNNKEKSKNDEKIKCTCDKYNERNKCTYNQMMEIKQKKLDKYENLIKTKNMYKDLWKNLKKKNMKKNVKNKNNSKKNKKDNVNEHIPNPQNLQNENLNQNILYKNSNLKIIKNDTVQYEPYFERKKENNKTEIKKDMNKNFIQNLKNLIVFKKQKDYKHYDNIANNYNFYERNESERKKVKNNSISEYINILNRIRNETNKSNVRNIYNIDYGNVPDIIDDNNKYGNHHVYVSTNINYDNNKIKSNVNHKLTNINMNKVSFKNIENITNTIKNNHSILKTNNFNNIQTHYSNSNRKNMNKNKQKEKVQMNLDKSYLNNSSNYSFSRNKNMKKNKSYLNSITDKSISEKENSINKSQKKPLNNLKKYETKIIKTYFDYSNNLENYNNINRKEIKYCNTDKKNNNYKINNYNYYDSSQHIQKYNFKCNLRDKFNEEVKNDKISYYINKENINNKKEEKNNNNIKYIINKETKPKSRIINYHSSRKNHNFYECKSMNTKKLTYRPETKLINNQIMASYNKKNNNNIVVKSINTKNEIKKNLNEKFQNMNNNIISIDNNLVSKYNTRNKIPNLTRNKKVYNNIKVTSISNMPTNKTNNINNSIKVKQELNKMKIILKINKRKSHSYSPNKKIKKSYFIYGKNNKIILDMKLSTNNQNKQLNYSQSTKILKKIKKEKNEIIKMNKLKKNLTEKNVIKIPFNNIKKKKIIKRKKSYDSIMPPNKLNEIYKKNK